MRIFVENIPNRLNLYKGVVNEKSLSKIKKKRHKISHSASLYWGSFPGKDPESFRWRLVNVT